MTFYTEREVLPLVIRCAELYEKELNNRNLLFLGMDKHNQLSYFEVVFRGKNFLHMTGLKLTHPSIMSASGFYLHCLSHNLSIEDFSLDDDDGTTSMKLEVLPSILNKNLSAKMIGDYNSNYPKLYTEKLAGGTKACVGFVRISRDDEPFIPNTLLKEDLRNITTSYVRIIATYRKFSTENKYTEVVYSAKGVNWESVQFSGKYAYLPKPKKENESDKSPD